MPIKAEVLGKIVEQARQDPEFFHALVFEPERAFDRIEGIERQTKATLLGLSPEAFIGRVLGGETQWCGETCGSSSCTSTCGMRSCDDTCASSCGGDTCSHSCTKTTSIDFLDQGGLHI